MANRFARFWVEPLDAAGLRRYVLHREPGTESVRASGPPPTVPTDAHGWPVSATWPGMQQPLFTSGLGDFVSVRVNAFAPRWALQDIWGAAGAAKRQLQEEKLAFIAGTPGGPTAFEETPHTLRYTQPLEHPRLAWATRRLEIWKREPRARLTFRLNRRSSFDPELLCVVSPLPCDGTLPRLSSGGLGFTPFSDQMPGTCRDYFAIDGWAHYATPSGHWLWVTRDAPLITLDGPHPKSRITAPPPRTGRLLAILFDNFWYTNFQGDSPGVMEFQFDLVWRAELADDREADALAQTLTTDPVIVLNPALPEHPLLLEHLFRP
ncbi:MAG: hypothetical protein M5U12_27460 [Verrucomicrobia bacterium]|nr:hypothetical protein [Verrucomicrobiota bacterium]